MVNRDMEVVSSSAKNQETKDRKEAEHQDQDNTWVSQQDIRNIRNFDEN